ncbi:P-loop containing nucleoside triphosphate hydrolase protein [Paraphysoderma sedebokerense]|nr:P-loop containing nucleoside triphosphate hydrolase protein [Paraphysoderma sedebokerense]
MEQTYDTLASHLLSLFHARLEKTQQDAKLNKRILIGLAGPPGSGKSTIAKEVRKRVNDSWKSNGAQESENEICVVVGMDGWHYYKAELDQMENPQYLHARRGIPATFNLPSFLSFLTHLSSSPCQYPTTSPSPSNPPPILYAPSFSHSKGDPIPSGIAMEPRHCIVIVEGNYVLFI